MSDIGDIIRMKLEEANPEDLINLAKSTHYMKTFPNCADLYHQVHARASVLKREGNMSDDVFGALSSIYNDHKIFTDSPFI